MNKVFYILVWVFAFISNSFGQITVGLLQHNTGTLDDGYVLFAPLGSTNTYLIDKCGNKVKAWPSLYKPGLSCYLLQDGTLLRTGNANNVTFNAGGKGGIIQKINWNGNVTWSYTISSINECQHHDIKALPNGNVLAIVWEAKSDTEAIAQGRNPSLTTPSVWSEKIIEIQPVGATGGNIVWEWHLWDHLIQDFDNSKPNYGAVSSNPQLLNINFNASANAANGQDWIHMNSIDYNPALDQILVSAHSINEIWIIDHSTNTAQAASHTDGNSGKGGDILYRWGNPQAYNNGTVVNQIFFGQHNAHWIENNLPFQNQIMVFNNGLNRTGGNYSTIEIVNPPINGFNYTATLPYLPASASWMYNAGNQNNFYAQNISGAQQLSNGNVLFCNGPSGTFTEIDSMGTKVWEYVNPVSNAGIINQGTSPSQNPAFRSNFYPNNYAGFNGQVLTPTTILEDSNLNTASCSLTLGIGEYGINESAIYIYPNPANQLINISFKNDVSNNLVIEILDQVGRVVYNKKSTQYTSIETIDISKFSAGVYFVLIKLDNNILTKKIIVD